MGLITISYALLRLLGSVEATFNDLWNISNARPFIRKVSDYLTVSVVVPFVLFLTVSLSTVAKSNALSMYVSEYFFLGGVREDLLRSLRFLFCGAHSLSRIIFCPTRVFRYMPHFLVELLEEPCG